MCLWGRRDRKGAFGTIVVKNEVIVLLDGRIVSDMAVHTFSYLVE